MQKRLEDREIINEEKNLVEENKAHVGLSKISVLVYETPETCEADSRLVEWRVGWRGGERERMGLYVAPYC